MTVKQTKALTALFQYPTREQAAKAAGVGSSTLRKWMQTDEEFQTAYSDMLGGIIEDAATAAKTHLSEAIQTIAEVMKGGTMEQVRLTAAKYMIEYTLKLHEALELENRVAELENRIGELENE